MPETTTTAEPRRHQSGGLAVALAKLHLDALTGADAVADVATAAGENVTTAIRADLKECRAETETRLAQVDARCTEVNTRVEGVAHLIPSRQKAFVSAFPSLQRENTTIRWMLGTGFTMMGLFLAISTFLRSSGSLRVPTRFVQKYTRRARLEPSGAHDAVEGGTGHAGDRGDGGLGDAQLEETPDVVLLAVEA